MREFNYTLLDSAGEPAEKIVLPVLLNIGCQFETWRGSFGVCRIVKDERGTQIFAQRINSTPWLLEHLEKSEYLVINKSLPVL